MTSHRGHELKFLKVNEPRAPRDGRGEPLPDEIGTYKVVGRQEVAGVKRGHLVDLPEAQALRLLKAGAIEVYVPTQPEEAPVADTETPADNPVADETGHSPETVESE